MLELRFIMLKKMVISGNIYRTKSRKGNKQTQSWKSFKTKKRKESHWLYFRINVIKDVANGGEGSY